MLAEIRAFFREAGVMEVETPACSRYASTDPALDSFETRYPGPETSSEGRRFLHTSPEFPMKRLLAAGSGAIYQLCKVFRAGERGRFHNPEFTLLEWYRPGFDHFRLMDEVEVLVSRLLGTSVAFERCTYRQLFQRHLGLDPHGCILSELEDCARRQGVSGIEALRMESRDAWLDLLQGVIIDPRLGRERPCFVYDYPASKASLARLRPGPPPLAERFELYVDGMELANGFHELADAVEQRERFGEDLRRRTAEGRRGVPMDEALLAALEHGLPDCAGVALGVDRLLMARLGATRIDEVLAFPFERA